MKAASLLLCAVSVCSASSSPSPDDGKQTPPGAASSEAKAPEQPDADSAPKPDPEPVRAEGPAPATGPTKAMRVRVPGAPLRSLDRLAKVAECAAAPEGLSGKSADAVAQAATAYAAGRDVEAAGLLRSITADLKSGGSLPATICHLTHRTMVASEPALARVASIHAYDTRRLAEIEVRLTDLRKKMTRTEPKIAVTITRWRNEPGEAGSDESAEAGVQLVRSELKKEIEHLKALRKLVQVRLEVVAGMLDAKGTTSPEALQTKLEKASKAAGSQSGTKAREVKGLLEKVAGPAPVDLSGESRAAAAAIAEVEAATKHALGGSPELASLLETATAKSAACIDDASADACVELADAAQRLAKSLAGAP